jgi:hypothetical protein
MIVEVLYQVRNEDTGVIEGFEQVANVDAPEHYDTDRALEYAFRRCQNIEGSWSMGETIVDGQWIGRNPDFDSNVTVVKPLRTWSDGRVMGHRSAMMYDRMVIDGETYEVAPFGFRKLEA